LEDNDFAARLTAILTGGALTMLISLGARTGLFEAAARGPATSAELAGRAGLHERYVREWLAAMAAGGIFTYDPADQRYTLPHPRFLTGESASNMTRVAAMLRGFGGTLPELERCFAEGGGVPRSAFAAHVEAAGGEPGGTWKPIYREHLVDGFIGAVPGLTERLAAGASVLDLGCGAGHAISVAARAFPASKFTGLDIDPGAIAAAKAAHAELPNAEFVVGDAAELAADPPYDVITAFDAIHDQDRPDLVLGRVHAALAPDGVFVMVDTKFSSRLERNIGDPLAALGYATSLMYCTTTSLAEGGAALGLMWGTELASEMLAAAGFGRVDILGSPRPQNAIYVCGREKMS